MNNTENKFYVYAWYYKDTNKIFYIGKGTRKRYLERKIHRNQYFINILNKEQNNVDVKFISENLYEQDAFDLERKLINEYWKIGECKANFHEGGCGGNTGAYNDEFKEKLRNFAKTRVGEKNPMYGKTHSEEARKKNK